MSELDIASASKEDAGKDNTSHDDSINYLNMAHSARGWSIIMKLNRWYLLALTSLNVPALYLSKSLDKTT